jgi:alpha-mannosidase
LIEGGPVRWVVGCALQHEDIESLFEVRYIVYPGLPIVDTEIHVDWKDLGVLVKVAYHLTTDSPVSVAEIPYAVIERATQPQTAHDRARWEHNTQTFVEMPARDRGWGVAFLNEGKYGFWATPDYFDLTVLRKGRYPKVADEAWCLAERRARIDAGEYIATTSDEHYHIIRQRIYPHDQDWVTAGVAQEAHAFNSSIVAGIVGPVFGPPLPSIDAALTCSPACVEVGALKVPEPLFAPDRGDHSYVLRVVNLSPNPVEAALEFKACAVASLEDLDMLERPIVENHPITYDREARLGVLSLAPFEIRTLRVVVNN